jgi:hypothetical protein
MMSHIVIIVGPAAAAVWDLQLILIQFVQTVLQGHVGTVEGLVQNFVKIVEHVTNVIVLRRRNRKLMRKRKTMRRNTKKKPY